MLMLEWKSFGNDDILSAFRELGHTVKTIPFSNKEVHHNEETEAEVIKNVVYYIKIFLPFISVHAVSNIFHSIFRGIKSNRHLFISTTVCSIVGIIAAYILCPIMGITGYYLQAIVAWGAECVYIAVVYFTGLWIPKEIRPMISKKRE